jgi:hypothetical protein
MPFPSASTPAPTALSSGLASRLAALRPFLGVFILNLLLAFPLFYTTYKQYDEKVTPWDTRFYMGIVESGPLSQDPPFRFRILTALAVNAMRPLPGYDIPIDFSDDPVAKRDFFHFVILNGFLTVLTSALLFVWLRRRITAGYAWAGSVMYLFSFYTIICGFIPMADPASQLGLLAGIFAFEARKPLWFALACLIVTFAKDAGLIALLAWVLAYSLRDRRNLVYLLWGAPAVAAWYAAHKLFPGPLIYTYYSSSFLFGNLFAAFRPSSYGLTGFLQVVLAQLPFIAAVAGWLWLRVRGAAVREFLEPGLLLVPALWWLGMTIDIWTNTGRLIFMAFPAMMLFQVRVLRAYAQRWGVVSSPN